MICEELLDMEDSLREMLDIRCDCDTKCRYIDSCCCNVQCGPRFVGVSAKWMVKIRENPYFTMDDLGGKPLFLG